MTARRFALLVGLLCITSAGVRGADDEKSWKGEKVLPTKPAKDIKFGDRIDDKQIEFPYSGQFPLNVRNDREGWLRIFDGNREGWALKDDFVLVNDAPAYFHRRVQADPKDTFALYMRGNGWDEKGEYDNAIKDFDECIRLDPTDASPFMCRGVAWHHKKEYDKAIKDYDEAIRLDPKNSYVFNGRGSAWRAKKEYDKAIKDYDEAIRLDPNEPAYFNNRGLVCQDKNEIDKAIKDFDEAIRLDSSIASQFNTRGNAWRAKKEYDKAIKDYDEAIRLEPKDAWARYDLAVVLSLTRNSDALSGYRTTIELASWTDELATYATILGSIAARQAGDEKAANKFLSDSAGKLKEAWPYPAVQFLRGDLDEKQLLKLADTDDKRTEARCFLGLHHVLKGNKDEALAHFRWVKEHGKSTFTEYTIAVAELDRLEKPTDKPKR